MRIFSFLLIFLFAQSFAQQASGDSLGYPKYYENDIEGILSFKSFINVDKDPKTIKVKEQIKVRSKGEEIKRGIVRSLPLSRELKGRRLKVKTEILSVKKDGEAVPYKTKTEDELKIYIGSEDTFLNEGDYEYEIEYTATNQIGFYNDFDELYWNVSGNGWGFDIGLCEATITFPEGAEILQQACYTGAAGSTDHDCSSKLLSKNVIHFQAYHLAPHEGLTVAAGIKKGIIQEPEPPTFGEQYFMLFLILLISLVGSFFLYRRWQAEGKDPEKPLVIPQYSVPRKLSVADLGYILKEDFDKKLVSASLTHLAVKKYIKIEEEGKRVFKIIKLKDVSEDLPEEEQVLLECLFKNGRKSFTIESSYDEEMERMVEKFRVSVTFKYTKLLETKLNLKASLRAIGVFLLSLMSLGVLHTFYFNSDWGGLLTLAMTTGIVFFAVLIVCFWPMRYLAFRIFLLIVIGLEVVGSVFFLGSLYDPDDISFSSLMVFGCIGAQVMFYYAYLMTQPDAEKLKIQSEIEGFKMYLGAAETKLMQFHNPPKMTPEVFQKYLPYAMVLGVQNIWGKKFSNVLNTMSEEEREAYEASAPYVSVALYSSLASSISVSSIAPTSSSNVGSSSSWSSGSSGGGFSGGGGGGGGGGGW